MATFIFTRQGETEDTIRQVFSGGDTDSEPTELGRGLSADHVLDLCRSRQIDICLTSGMKRARVFGDIFARVGKEFHNPFGGTIPVFHDVRLKEKLAGIFEGTTRDSFLAVDGEAKYTNRWRHGLPNGESHLEVCVRVLRSLYDWTQYGKDKTFFVGSHTDVIRAMMAFKDFASDNPKMMSFLTRRIMESLYDQHVYQIPPLGELRASALRYTFGFFSPEEVALFLEKSPELFSSETRPAQLEPKDDILTSKIDYFQQVEITLLPEVLYP